MGDLNYKVLQEQGVFDVPYKAFKFMEKQQKEINDLLERIDQALSVLSSMKQHGVDEAVYILKGGCV